MPQVQLPLFPAGTTHLNASLAFECPDGQVPCFSGPLPVFTHAQGDRAKTALVGTVREKLARPDEGRARVRELRRTTADLRPDREAKTLTVHRHPLASGLQEEAVRHSADELTATETLFPGTDLRLLFALPGPS